MNYAEQKGYEISTTFYPRELEHRLRFDILELIQEGEREYLDKLKSKAAGFAPLSKKDNFILFNLKNLQRSQSKMADKIFLGFSPYSIPITKFIKEMQKRHETYYKMINPIKSIEERFPNLEGLIEEKEY